MGVAIAEARRIAERICGEHGFTLEELCAGGPRAGQFTYPLRELSVALRDLGMQYSAIGRLVCRDHSTIINAEKIGRGVKTSATVYWRKADDDLFRRLAPNWEAIARETGRSVSAVKSRARKVIYGRSERPVKYKYTAEEIAHASALVQAGASYREAALAIDTDRRALARALTKVGVTAIRRAKVERAECAERRQDLKPEIERHLADINTSGLSFRDIARAVGCGLSLVEYVAGLTRAEWEGDVPQASNDLTERHISYLEACADELGATSNRRLRQLYTLRCERPDDDIPASDSAPWRGRIPHVSDYRSIAGSSAGMCADV